MTVIEKLSSLSHPLTKGTDTEIESIGGLYPRGFFSLFASPAGTGKTWFMQYLASQLSVGGNILHGLRINDTPKKCVVLAGETGKYLLDRRAKLTDWRYDPDRLKVFDAIEMQREGLSLMLNEPDGRNIFLAIIAQEAPDIIFIDTLISFHTADESKQGEMTSIYGFLLRTAKNANCAIVANHHTRKRSTKNPTAMLGQDDVIGTNAGARLASCIYIAEQVQDGSGDSENDGLPVVLVRNVKSWNRKVPDFIYRFYRTQYAPYHLDFAITWGSTANMEDRSLRERMYGLIASFGVNGVITTDIVSRELCTTKDNARKLLAQLETDAHLEKISVPMGKGTMPAWRIKSLVSIS